MASTSSRAAAAPLAPATRSSAPRLHLTPPAAAASPSAAGDEFSTDAAMSIQEEGEVALTPGPVAPPAANGISHSLMTADTEEALLESLLFEDGPAEPQDLPAHQQQLPSSRAPSPSLSVADEDMAGPLLDTTADAAPAAGPAALAAVSYQSLANLSSPIGQGAVVAPQHRPAATRYRAVIKSRVLEMEAFVDVYSNYPLQPPLIQVTGMWDIRTKARKSIVCANECAWMEQQVSKGCGG